MPEQPKATYCADCGHPQDSHGFRYRHFGTERQREYWHACCHRTNTERWLSADGSCPCNHFTTEQQRLRESVEYDAEVGA